MPANSCEASGAININPSETLYLQTEGCDTEVSQPSLFQILRGNRRFCKRNTALLSAEAKQLSENAKHPDKTCRSTSDNQKR